MKSIAALWLAVPNTAFRRGRGAETLQFEILYFTLSPLYKVLVDKNVPAFRKQMILFNQYFFGDDHLSARPRPVRTASMRYRPLDSD